MEQHWQNSKPLLCQIYWVLGLFIAVLGFILFIFLNISIMDPDYALKQLLFGGSQTTVTLGPLSWSSWGQTAVAFGMHSFADVNAGIRMMKVSEHGTRVPQQVSVWNVTRFVISGLWALVLLQGLVKINQSAGRDLMEFSPAALTLLSFLIVDTIIVRPSAIYIQRKLEDANPPTRFENLKYYMNYNFIQKCCNFVFFYESILSGCSGAVYFVFPQLFVWLYGYPLDNSDVVSLWCLSQFGVLVMAFGLYQMNADIDRNNYIIAWWLLLDFVWMYIYWEGTKDFYGYWNPLTGFGANFWCHSAFHADSTLAVARTWFLWESWAQQKREGGDQDKKAVDSDCSGDEKKMN